MKSTTFLRGALLAIGTFLAGTLQSAVIVTEPTGGQNISADKALTSTNGAGFTSLGNIVITEGSATDFAAGNNQTLILTIPSGWRFNAGVGSVTFSGSRDITAASISVTASNLTVTYSVSATAKSDSMTISGLQVQPLDGANAPLAGYIQRVGYNPGSGVINGIANDVNTFGLCNILAGAARALAMQTDPAPEAVAGNLFDTQPEVRVLDQFGNLRELDTTTAVTASRLAGTGTLQGSLTQVAIVGICTYTNVSHNVAGTISILFTSPGLTSVTSAPVVITPALADHLVFTTQPGSASVSSPFGIQPVVKTQDRFGNLSTTGLNGSQMATIGLAAGTGPLLGTTTLDLGTNGGNGIATFTNLEIDAAGTNKQLQATSSGMTNGLSAVFAVSAAAFSKLQILVPGETAAPGTATGKTGTPSAQSAGTPFNVIVNAVDANWNLVNTISDSIAISSTDGAAGLPASAPLVAGTKTFSVTLNTVGSTTTITASDATQPSKTANTSPAITVGGGTPAKLTIQTQPSATATAGVPFAQQAVVRVEDVAGNLVAVDNGRIITVARGSGTGTLQGTLTATTVNGLATFANVSYNVAESLTLVFSASGLSSATSSNVVVSPAAASKLAFSVQPGGASHVGAPLAIQPVIVSQDAFGNSSSVGLPSALPVSFTLTAGSGSLLGTTVYDIGTAAGNGIVTGSNVECSAPGTAKQLTATAAGLTAATSTAFVVGGLVTATGGAAISADTTGGSYTTLTGPTYLEGASGEAGAGTIVLNSPAGFVFDTGGTAPTVVITRLGGTAANSANINGVVSGNSVAITSRSTNQIVFTVNTASSSGVTCSLTWTNVRVRPLAGAPLASGNLTRTGTSTVVGLVNSVTSLGALTEVPGLASRLAFTTQPAAGVAGQPFGQQPIVKSRDQFGNDSTAGLPASRILSMALTSGSGVLLGTTNIDFGTNAGNGIAAFTDLEIDAALTTKQLTATAAGFTNAVSGVFTVASGPASRLTISTQPSSTATAGSAFAQQPVIRIEDQFGNLRNADNSTVVTAARNGGTGALQGTVAVTAVAGVVTFTNISHLVANTITIDFTAGSLSGATSSSIAVAPASASRLTIQTQPSAVANAGQPFPQQPVIRVEDAFGNLRTGDNATVVTATRNAGSGVLQGTTNMTALGGIVAFTNLTHTVVTNITIQFASGSLTSAVSGVVAINPALASRIVFSTQPASGTAGSILGSQPVLKTQDALGNDSAVGLPGDLNVLLTLSTGSGPLQGTTSLNIGTNAGNGHVTFSDLRIDAAGTNKQLTATAAGMIAATSTVFTVVAGAADHLTIQSQPSGSATAGVALAQQPVVRLEDAFGNLLISDNASLVTAAVGSGSAGLQGTTTRAALGGIVSFTNLSYNVAETITLSFSSGSLNSVVSSNVIVSAAPASRLTIQTQPSASALAGVAFAAQPVIRVEDSFGNLRANDNATVVTAARLAGSGVLQGTTTATANAGIVSFVSLAHNVATNITIQFTSAGLASATSTSVAITPAAAARLTIQTQPSATVTAGSVFGQQPVLRVEDTFGNLVFTDTSTVVTASRNAGNGTLLGTLSVTAVNGLVSFTDLSHKVANTISIDFSAPGLTGTTSSSVLVNAGPFIALQLLAPGETAAPATISGKTGSPNAQAAGTPFNVTVNAVDAYWNVVTNVTDSISITSSDSNAALPANAALVGGVKSFAITLKTAGSATVSAADITQPAKSGSTSPSILVSAGVFTKLQLLLPGESAAPGTATGKTGSPTAQTAGTAFSVLVNAVDANWNVISSVNDAVSFTSSDANGVLPLNGPLSSGTGAFNVTLKTAGSRTVTVSDASDVTKLSNTGAAVTVNAAAFAGLQIIAPGETAMPGTASGKTGSPSAQTAGTAFNVTVNAVDAYWNLVSSVIDVVNIAASDVNAALPANSALSSGTKVFSVTLKTAGSMSLTASDVTDNSKPAGSIPSIQVNNGAFAKLQLLLPGESAAPGTATGKTGSPAAQTAGAAFTVNVNAVDANWNVITTAGDTIGITSSDANATLPANGTLVNGTKSFSVTLKTAGNKTLTASDITDAAKTASSSPAITVNPGAFVKLQILVPGETAAPGSSTGKTGTAAAQTIDATFLATVNAVDANWNLVQSASDMIAITSGDAAALLPANATLSSGSSQFVVALGTQGTATLTASDVADNTKTPGTSALVTVSPAPYVAATGGSAISADTFAGTFTSLTGPVYSEPTSGSIGTGTIILKVPTGFVFDTGGTAPTVLVTRLSGSGSSANNINGATSGTILPMTSITTTQVVFTVTSISGSGINCSLTWQNLRVRPSAGTPLAKGKMRMAGTSVITGVGTNSNLGLLTEVAGTARQLAIQTQPSAAAIAGITFAQQPVLQVQDQFSNPRTNDSATVITATRNAGSGTLQGSTTALAANGIVSFTNLAHNIAGNLTIDFSGAGITNATSSMIVVSPASATGLAFSTQPAGAAAGATFVTQPVVRSQDIYGNPSTVGLPTSLMLNLTLNSGLLQGTTTLDIGTAAGNGAAGFTDLRIDAAGAKQLTASAPGLGSVLSSNFVVGPGAANRLTIVTQPSAAATAGAVFGQQPVVRIEDAFGNVRTSDNTTLISAARNTGSAALQGTTALSVSSGVATFSNLSYSTAETMDITFSSAGLTGATSSGVVVSPAAASRLTIAVQPSATAIAGTVFAQQPVIRVEDQYGNLRTSDNSTVVSASRSTGTASLLGGTNVAVTGGVATFNNLSYAVAESMNISFASAGLSNAITSMISVSPGAFAKLLVLAPGESLAPGTGSGKTGAPTTQSPDAPFMMTVSAVDNLGNIVTSITDAIGLTATDPMANIPALTNLLNGSRQIPVTFTSPGTNSITVTDISTPTIAAVTSSDIVVNARFAPATGGSPISADTVGGAFTALSGPAYSEFASGEAGLGTIILNAPAGFVFDTAGTAPTVRMDRLTGSGINSKNINGVASGTALALTSMNSTQLVFTVTSVSSSVTCKLTWQNVRVRPSAGTPLAVGKLTKTGTATLVGVTNAVSNFGALAEVAGAAANLSMEVQPSLTATAGVVFAQQPVVGIRDRFGNLRADNGGVVNVTRMVGAGSLQGVLSATATNGLATFASLSHLVATNITLAFSSSGLTGTVSSAINVGPAAASQLVFTTQPGNATYGAPLPVQPVVRAQDSFGNNSAIGLAASVPLTLGLNAGSGSLQGTLVADIGTAAGNGVAQFTNIGVDTAGSGKQLGASCAGLSAATSDAFSVGQATQSITFGALAGKTYGDASFALSASASSGLPVAFSIVSGPASLSLNMLSITGAGTVVVRATQAGDSNWLAASNVDQTFSVGKALLNVKADDKTRVFGAANPAFTVAYNGFVNGDNGSVLAGNPVVTSLADSNSPVSGGPYAITASVGSLSAANYQFGFAPGQLTITPAQSLLTVAVSSPMVATGNPVTLTATVAPILSGSPLPSGTIQFTVDGVDFGAPVGINTGIANLSTAALAHGAHSLSARFGGDGNFFGSTNNTPVSVVVDTAPVALLASYSRYSDSPLQIAVSDLITNFTTDVDGDALTVTFVGSGTNGANVSIAGGSITYTPSGTSSNANAGDYLQYVVSDGFTGGTATNFIAITVSGSNPNTQPTTITGIVAISGGMKITFSGAALTEYHMQRANVLLGDGTGWNDMGPVTTDSNGQGEFIDSSAPADQAFYRIARPQ